MFVTTPPKPRRFKIVDESSKYGPCFVVRELTYTGPILGYQWEMLVWCRTRADAESYIRSEEQAVS
jgi:hypothetical protein